MKTIIRQSVFETNSSSTHSISISDKSDFTTIHPEGDGNIYLNGGEFGWEIEEYTDPLTKANYCAIDNASNEERVEMLKRVIKEHTKANDVIINANTEDYKSKYHSYIDHQSNGTSEDAFESEETLKNFIFRRDSVLYTDNDNH
jgi:hypothetical protein